MRGLIAVLSPGRMSAGLILVLTMSFCSGCGLPLGTFTLGELLPLVQGEFNILAGARPVQQVVNDPATPAEIRDKLIFSQEVRQFAIDQLGLKAGNSYTTYFDTGSNAPSYTVQASPMTRLEPVLFDYPLAGTVPYAAFFDFQKAQDYADQLHAEGDDTMVSEVPAYSTLGLFPDPIYTTFLKENEIVVADTICHELTHNTVFSDDVDFSESLASYVGRYGAQLFYQVERADDPAAVQVVKSYYHDTDLFSQATGQIFETMDAYYKSQAAAGASDNEIKIGRQVAWKQVKQTFLEETLPLFDSPDDYRLLNDIPLNNALLLSWRRYNLNLKIFDQVRVAVGGEIRDALPVYKAAGDSSDPFGYLDNWLRERGIEPQNSP